MENNEINSSQPDNGCICRNRHSSVTTSLDHSYTRRHDFVDDALGERTGKQRDPGHKRLAVSPIFHTVSTSFFRNLTQHQVEEIAQEKREIMSLFFENYWYLNNGSDFSGLHNVMVCDLPALTG